MSTMETKFEFDKLNRVPKNSIKQAIQEYKEVFPNKALNRYVLCQIIAQKLEAKYLRPQLDEEISDLEVEVEVDTKDSKSKKNYNGQHILKKMKLDTTGKILEKIDFYIYRYY